MPPCVRDGKEGATVVCRVLPNSSKTAVTEVHDEYVKIKVAAPPVDGKANKELVRFLAKLVKIPKSGIEIVKGETGKQKTVLLHGIAAADVAKILEGMT